MLLRRTVPAIGPQAPSLMLIGEAPGENEERFHKPFCGWAGKFLQEMVSASGIPWDSIRIDNVVQYRPPANNFGIFYEDSKRSIPTPELLGWYDDLKRRIRDARPKVVVCAGDEPLKALTGHRGVTEWRGSVIEGEAIGHRFYIVPIVHPSFARRCWLATSSKKKQTRQPWFNITVLDLRKAQRITHEGWHPIPRTEIVMPSYQEVMGYLGFLEQDVPTSAPLTIDIETVQPKAMPDGGPNGFVACCGITHTHDSAMCIPFISSRNGEAYFTFEQEVEVWKALDRVCMAHPINGQNIPYDAAWLDRETGLDITDSVYIDTAVLHSLLYAELAHDLGFLTSIYTDLPYFKYLGREEKHRQDLPTWFRYNAQDVYATHEIAQALTHEAKKLKQWDYYLNRRLPLLRWAMRQHKMGLWVDPKRKESVLRDLRSHICNVQEDLDGALVKCGYDPLNVASSIQVKNLLVSLGFKIPNTQEETLLEFAEDSLLVSTIMQQRKDRSFESKFDKAISSDGCIRTTLSLYVTETTRLASRRDHFGSGCLLPEAEVLTPEGWIPICQFKHGLAMIWNPQSKDLLFDDCDVVSFPFEGSMVKADARFHKNCYTPNHTIPWYSPKLKSLIPMQAHEAATRYYGAIPISGEYKQGINNWPWIRLLVAAFADGSFERRGIRFGFEKKRKIERLLELAKHFNCNVSFQKGSRRTQQRIYLTGSVIDEITLYYEAIKNVYGHKTFGSWILGLDQETLIALVDELQYWDGHVRNRSYWVFTTIPDSAYWIQTAAHLIGASASVQVDYDNNNGYGQGSNKPLYTVNIKPRSYTRVERKHWSSQYYKGNVWCLTTATGYFLVRYQGIITITGNTNLQNVNRRARPLIAARPGCVFVELDLSQAEARCVAWYVGDPELKKPFVEGLDVHTQRAAIGTGTDYAELMTLVKAGDPDAKRLRQAYKRCVHAVNYDVGIRTLGRSLLGDGVPMPERDVRKLYERIHELFPGIRTYQMGVQEALKRNRTLITALGGRRYFFSRLDQNTFRRGYAYLPQRTVAEMTNDAIVATINDPEWQELGGGILLQGHDSLLLELPESVWQQGACIVKKYMERPVTIYPFHGESDVLAIPTDLSVGSHWGELEKTTL